MNKDEKITMRAPFADHQISALPKATISADEYKKLPKSKCSVCGGYHPATNTIHLDYVGHAALTDRLLDVDPSWTWEPVALKDGLPAFDATGGLWIKLTVLGVTRLGYGNAKTNSYADIGSREKEVIGDALRNAAMRFGAALELWHKGQLHLEDEPEPKKPAPAASGKGAVEEVFNKLPVDMQTICTDLANHVINEFNAGKEIAAFKAWHTGAAHDGDRPIEGYDNDLKMAVWSKLPSQVRTALKRISNEQKGQA